MRITFDLFSPHEVIDSHPEFADMDNPEGYIYGFGLYLRATDDMGRRWLGARLAMARTLAGVDELQKEWEVPLKRMTAHGKMCGDWLPHEPEYGSAAYMMDEFVNPSEGYASNP